MAQDNRCDRSPHPLGKYLWLLIIIIIIIRKILPDQIPINHHSLKNYQIDIYKYYWEKLIGFLILLIKFLAWEALVIPFSIIHVIHVLPLSDRFEIL